MAVIKVYSRINWLNKLESLTTPLGKTNLNKMDKAIDTIDNEIVSISANVDTIDTTKADKTQLNNMVTDISFNDKNGVISITKYNGTTLNIDTAIEKIAVNFEYNAQTQQLIITLESGEKQYIDMSALITQYEFKDTDTIAFNVDGSGKVSASIKNGSITKAMLSSEIISAITLSENNAAASAKSAEQSATNADMDAKMSQSYAIGRSGIRDGEDADNAKFYYEQSKTNADTAVQSATNAASSENNANSHMKSAQKSADMAAQSTHSALEAETIATEKASEAAQSATDAKQSETNIKNAEENCDTMAKTARSYAVVDTNLRENEDTDNSKYYAKEAEKYAKQAEDIAGGKFVPLSEKGIAGGVATLNDDLAVEKAVGDEDSNNIKETYAKKTEIPALIKVDGSTITKDEDGTLHGSASIDVDAELSETSTNPVENRVIANELNKKADSKDIPTSLPAKGGDADTVNKHTVKSDVPENAVFTDTIYTLPTASGTQLGGVKVDNKTVFISSDGTLSAKGGGSSIKPKSVSNASIVTDKGQVTIKWTDPTDIVVDEAILSQWQKTVLVYKQGTTAPTSINDGTVAMAETTRNQYQTRGYTITGLTDGNDYSFSLFAISTDGTSSDATNLTAKLYANLTVTTEDASLYGKKVTATKGSSTVTGTFSNSGSVTLKVLWTGETTVTASDGTDTTSTTVNIVEYGKSYTAELSFFKIVTFADGTDEEITAMIKAHYNNRINITDYWAVGDKRKVNLSAMSATYVGESHRAQTVEYAIADFEHDDLTTAINGHTKAAVTLTQVDCLMDVANSSNPVNGSTNTENGYMNSSNTNKGGWKNCSRRTWCNNVYLKALPSTWQNIVKTVSKRSGVGSTDTTTNITSDKIFLLAEIEVFGSTTHTASSEGTQYQYYKNATASRYKMPKWNSSNNSNAWWERSAWYLSSQDFCYVGTDGTNKDNLAAFRGGIAPCLCI